MPSLKGQVATPEGIVGIEEREFQLELFPECRKPSPRGMFVTFEGGEGTGKSTQIKLLSDYLHSIQINNIQTKEPGGTEIGQELRSLLVTGDKDKFDAVAEALLYYADRRIHLTNKIWPALNEGTWVLSDRFADSTVAYQYYGYDKRVDKQLLDELYKIAVGDFKPDLTIILDLEPEVGLARSFNKAKSMEVKELRFEGRELAFHQNLRRGFLEIAAAEPQRCVVLDADKTIEALHRDIVKIVNEKFGI